MAGSVQESMPEIDPLGFLKILPMFILTLLVPRVIGLFAARYIYKNGATILYDKQLGSLAEEEGWVFLAAVVFGFVVSWVNNYPMFYKGMVMRFNSGNLRANMMIYKAVGSDEKAPHVVLETEGPVGSYNRANRSLTHFIENSLPVVIAILLAGRVFAKPTFFCSAVFAMGRIMHQIGYASIGYGAHAPGFLITALSTAVLEGFCILIAAKNLGYSSLNVEGVYKFEL
mmetsp:Transcript_110659/g.219967  ORF Transcript_110659/g.219967 Transcript_110659/m.219967 type:complete len:228 (+) Transcript_110659:82-765(+)